MKRGFLNSKKARDKAKALSDNQPKPEVPAVAPPKQLQPPSGSTSAVSSSKKLTEPVVGCMVVDGYPLKSLEPCGLYRIPSLTLTKSFSTCIFRSSTCDKIVNTPGYYTPPPPLDLANVVFTKTIPNMGLGLFTKSNVGANQVIFSERPLLIFPGGQPFYNREGLSKEDAIKVHNQEFDDTLKLALGVMTKEDADAFTSLANCFPDFPQLYGIARTNSFGTGEDIEEENLEEGKFKYAMVGKLASRINHSCMPNVRVNFDVPTFSLQLIAERDIDAGGQLFYCYCQAERPVKERQRQLATYGFVCQCKACVNATPESDKLREEMDDRIRKIVDEYEEMLANPLFSIRSLGPLIKLEKDIVKEGLDFGTAFGNLLFVIMKGYIKLDDFTKKWEYYNRLKKYSGET